MPDAASLTTVPFGPRVVSAFRCGVDPLADVSRS